jgi:hypothetical protein
MQEGIYKELHAHLSEKPFCDWHKCMIYKNLQPWPIRIQE